MITSAKTPSPNKVTVPGTRGQGFEVPLEETELNPQHWLWLNASTESGCGEHRDSLGEPAIFKEKSTKFYVQLRCRALEGAEPVRGPVT